MTVRVYLFRTNKYVGANLADDYLRAWRSATAKWGDRVKCSTGYEALFDMWLEFDTEEEAALFKLTEL